MCCEVGSDTVVVGLDSIIPLMQCGWRRVLFVPAESVLAAAQFALLLHVCLPWARLLEVHATVNLWGV